MKLAWVADVHLASHKVMGGEQVEPGLNRRGVLVRDTLMLAYDMAMKEKCDALIVNGDLFDTARPPAQHIAEVQRIVACYPDIQTFILLGNHEMESDVPGDNALGPLKPVATVIEKAKRLLIKPAARGAGRMDSVELWAVPFRPGEAAEWLPVVLAEMQGLPASGSPASSTRVLALHLGLQDGKTPPWLKDSHDSVEVGLVQELMKRYDIDACYMGNWHDPKEVVYHDVDRSVTSALRIVQIGTLCPTGWDNPGLGFGTMAFFDSLKDKNCELARVPGPRFVSSVKEAQEALKDGCTPFVRLKEAPEDMEKAHASAEKLTQAGATVEVLPDTGEAQAALRTAAGVARSAETVEDAVAAYVGQMPLDEGVDRAAVLARVRDFLGGTA